MTKYAVLPPTSKSNFRIILREMAVGSVASPGEVWKRVQDIFDVFCATKGSLFSSSAVYWVSSPVNSKDIMPHELIAYLVPGTDGRAKSIIKTKYPELWRKKAPDGDTVGLSAVGNLKHISEIYVNHPYLDGDPEAIANTIIHELMHNKLDKDDSLHTADNGTIPMAGRFSEAKIPKPTSSFGSAPTKVVPSEWDLSQMGPALAKNLLQFAEI